MKKLLYILTLIPVLALAQSLDQNWVETTIYKQPTTTPITNPDVTVANVQITYFDGLGRPIQQVAHKQSNSGKDIVTHIEYDAFGRQTKEYLPYVNQTPSLDYTNPATVVTDLSTFYSTYNGGTTHPYSEKELEASPLNRVFKQAAPGDAWAMGSGKEIKFDYQFNETSDAVKLFTATASWDGNANNKIYNSVINDLGTYAETQLYKTITKDENWTSGVNNTTEEFKDKEGQVVLKRTYNNGDKHDTYYVYDQFGNLTYVLPPAAEGIGTQTTLDNLGYQYKYDYRSRLVEKKLPGKQWEFIIYDKLDRPVATGPAFSPYGGSDIGWMITEYDVFGRVTQTGWKQMTVSATSRTTNQNSVTSGSNPFVLSANDILTKNYYDDYSFPNAPQVPTQIEGQNTVSTANKLRGLPTGSWTKVLDINNPNASELSYTIYDERYRPVRTYTSNHLGGYTQVDSKLDWAGKTEYTITTHKYDTNGSVITVRDTFEYTDQDRLSLHKQQIGSGSEQLIAKNTYDELGQLISKNVGGQDATGASGLQTVDYNYNIRGWLKNINDVNNIGTDLFSFKINYNDFESLGDFDDSAIPLYNGNISSTYWKTSSDNILRKYNYSYDVLNRLLEANYLKPTSASTPDNYMEKLSYDKNGNILSLQRNGDRDTDGAQMVNLIDNLEYTYDTNNKNLLIKVDDASNSPQGFKNGSNTGNDYEYDANGNMTLDNNKGITKITYNHLNLPTEITFGTSAKILYLYNATGQKISKAIVDFVGGNSATTHYMSGGFQYKDNYLQFFPHAEGYVSVVDSHGVNNYNYVFNYTDHLGNIRLSYGVDPSTQTIKIMEENHYYAFGLKHTNYNSDQLLYQKGTNETITLKGGTPTIQPTYKYRYNSKEFQDELGLNVYDYDNRVYDQAVGRFWQIDPKTENGRRWSPYNYCFNNPVYFLDPDGMWPDPAWLKNYVKGAWSATINLAAGLATSTYNNASNGVTATKSVYNAYKNDGVKGAVKEYANQVYTTSGAKSAVATVKKASTGDAKAVATTVFNVVAITVVHKVAKGSGTAVEASEASAAKNIGTTMSNAEMSNVVGGGSKPAVQVTAELNGQSVTATSGPLLPEIAPQLIQASESLGGVGTKTSSGNVVGCCAEFRAANSLLLENPKATPAQINFTPATRPRTGQVIPMCENCQTIFEKK
ncbi:DUF6443 domain-containing protein [Flavobacterium sp. HNIBRBA15423]|uniref:DUF6443 domain-containing protein n=1 Tax=Flavobacterium sp. HNIBRBA15423 TaxID=3458683 RepID=UPI0040449928